MKQTHIVMLVFPQVTQLDLTAPAQVLSRMPDTRLSFVWHDKNPVMSDSGIELVPNVTFAQCEPADVVFVPGGDGAFTLFDDPIALDFIRDQSRSASWVTSVCTGSLALGAAGLLRGKRATTHWASIDMLASFGAIPVRERVVSDGNLMTGAGITSGLDFALTLAASLRSEAVAKRLQLTLEYDPKPPFDSGTPLSADKETVEAVVAATSERTARRWIQVERAANQLEADEGN